MVKHKSNGKSPFDDFQKSHRSVTASLDAALYCSICLIIVAAFAIAYMHHCQIAECG